MSGEQGYRFAGMRPAAIAAGRRLCKRKHRDTETEAVA
jgi:hypothetical protein